MLRDDFKNNQINNLLDECEKRFNEQYNSKALPIIDSYYKFYTATEFMRSL